MTAKLYEPELLDQWNRASNYVGAEWYGWYSSGVGRSRDSGPLERANFRAMLNLLGFDSDEFPSDDCPTVIDDDGEELHTRTIVCENHWAVGWVEWIAIHSSDADGLRIADKAMGRLEDYPILDENLYAEIEDNDCAETWANCYDEHERAAYLRERGAIIDGHYSELKAACRGCWYSAANLLPCPSDILH